MKDKKVGCYVRVSTENQLENYSIDQQIEKLKSYCNAKDWTIFQIYIDGGCSGGNLERPALKQMLQDIRHKNLNLVVVYKLDRLSRSQKDTLTLIEDEFLNHDVDFVSISENFDTSTPFGKAMIGILSVFSQLEKEQITERFTMGRIGRSKAGYYHGGPTAPTGYDYVDGLLVVNKQKSLQVQEIYELFLSGFSIHSIRKTMQTKYGGWTNHSLVRNILLNPVYIGKVQFNKQTYNGLHTPIIGLDTFEKVQMLLKSNAREMKKTAPQKTPFRACNLLTSIVYCKNCGARYSGSHGYYKCYSRSKNDKKYVVDPLCRNKNWKIEILDDIILDEIGKLKHNPNRVHEIFHEKTESMPMTIAACQSRILDIDEQITKLIDLYQIKAISVDEISSRVNLLQNEKESLIEKINSSEIELSIYKPDFSKVSEEFKDMLHSDSLERRRLFISNIIQSIEIDEHQIHIHWRI